MGVRPAVAALRRGRARHRGDRAAAADLSTGGLGHRRRARAIGPPSSVKIFGTSPAPRCWGKLRRPARGPTATGCGVHRPPRRDARGVRAPPRPARLAPVTLDPLTETAPHPVRRAVFSQHWGDLTMLHWPVDPALVAPLLPAGTVPDLLDGVTWVGLVPFVMSSVRIFGTPPLPHLSAFAETNVRLYAVDPLSGRRGVVFRSLEAARLLPVLAARASYRLPYMWARMSVRHGTDRGAPTVSYETARRWPRPSGVGGLVRVRIGPRTPADELSLFLTARWGCSSPGTAAAPPTPPSTTPPGRCTGPSCSRCPTTSSRRPGSLVRKDRRTCCGRPASGCGSGVRDHCPVLRAAWLPADRAGANSDLGLPLLSPAHLGAVRRAAPLGRTRPGLPRPARHPAQRASRQRADLGRWVRPPSPTPAPMAPLTEGSSAGRRDRASSCTLEVPPTAGAAA